MKVNQESENVGLNLNIQKSKIMASGPITSWQIDGETVEIVADFIFWCSKVTADFDCSLEIKRCLLLEWKVMTSLDSILKDREIALPGKVCLVKTMFFSGSHVWIWELGYNESWTPKSWCFWTVVNEKTLESLLDCKEFQPIHPKDNQSWIFIGRTDAEYETPVLWPPDGKNWLIWNDSDVGKDWKREEKRTMEDGMFVWHHEFYWILGIGIGRGSLMCCSPWGRKELDTTEWSNWTDI